MLFIVRFSKSLIHTNTKHAYNNVLFNNNMHSEYNLEGDDFIDIERCSVCTSIQIECVSVYHLPEDEAHAIAVSF